MNQGAQSARAEQSTLSKSVSNEQQKQARKELINGLSSKIDLLFPLMDEVLKYAQIKQGFYAIIMLFTCLQAITVSFWVQFNRSINTITSIQGEIVAWMIRICLFTPFTGKDTDLIIRFVVLSVGCIIYVTIIIYELIFFRNNRRFIRKTLYIARFSLDFIPLAMLIPCGNFVGIAFDNTLKVSSMLSISVFVIGVFEYVIFVGGHYVMSLIISATSYLPSSPNVCWNGKFNFLLLFGISFFALMGWFVTHFTYWTRYIFLIFKVMFNLFCFYKCIFIPFLRIETNSTVSALLISLTCLDIVEMMRLFGIKIDYYIHFIVLIVTLISTKILTVYMYKMIIAKVMKTLSYSSLDDIVVTERAKVSDHFSDQIVCLQDPVKRQHFFNDNLHKSKLKSLLYLRVGIAHACPLFIDWSLIKFLTEFHKSSSMYASILQRLSFFPSESRLMNYYFYLTATEIHLTIDERFCLYQTHRVKGFRQSSVSSEITEKLIELRQFANREINFARKFWETVPRDGSLLYEFATKTARTAHLFEESIHKWPNNGQMCRDFSQFLIECSTDFTEGLKMKRRAELIEQGMNFATDHAFKHLVQTYPLYLKKRIVDIKGNFISQKKITKGASSSNSSSYKSSVNSNVELDHEVEDTLAKVSFSYPRMRLAYQRSIENRKSSNNQEMKVLSTISLLVVICIITFLYFRYYSLFISRYHNLRRQLLLNNIRYGYDSIISTLLVYWANANNFIPDEMLGNSSFGMSKRCNVANEFNLQFSSDFHPFPPELAGKMTEKEHSMVSELMKWVDFTRNSLISFGDQISVLAGDGKEVLETFEIFLSKNVKFEFCEFNETLNSTIGTGKKVELTLKQAVTHVLRNIASVVKLGNHKGEDLLVDKGVCECIINGNSLFDSFDGISDSLSFVQIIEKNGVDKEDKIYLGAFVAGYLVIFLPSLLLKMRYTLKEIDYVLKMMSEIDKCYREEASKPLKDTKMSDDETLNERKTSYAIAPAFLYIMIAIFVFVVLGAQIIIILVCSDKNSEFLDIDQWQYYGITRGNYMLEIFSFTLMSIILKQRPGITKMLKVENTMAFSRRMVQNLLDENNYLLRGAVVNGTRVIPSIGTDEILDELSFGERCGDTIVDGTLHDSYRCASIDRGVSLLAVFVRGILDGIEETEIAYNQPIYHVFHLINNHLLDPTYTASTILINLAFVTIQKFQQSLNWLCFGAMALLIVYFGFFFTLLNRIDVAYSGALQLLRRLPPLCVIANQQLLNYLLNKKDSRTHEVMFTSKAVVMNTKDAVFCLNRNQTIEVVNKAVTSLFGYTPEQLLGQPISTIIREEDCKKLYEQFEYMLSGDTPLLYETKTVGATDDDQQLQISVTVIGISDNKNAESFVVIVKDISVLLKQQQEAQEAKKKSEDLLYQILPRDIVNRLNQGEKDISFVVQSATVIFIDIVKFSDYASSLTPAQIMENLSLVFAGIDAACAKYNLITKIKLIGDVYMAAANLFTEEESKTHATQVVQFALDSLQALEEVNAELDSSLQVRIGVNTDGPLFAGVLGTDKPVFDIIGDPINVAARLQSNGIAGTVQISETTYEAVIDSGFNIEKRGEIMLKGKGKKMAYIVRPKESSVFFSNA